MLEKLKQWEKDLENLQDINSRMYIAIWMRPSALSLKSRFIAIDDLPSTQGYGIVMRDEPVVKSKTETNAFLRPDVA